MLPLHQDLCGVIVQQEAPEKIFIRRARRSDALDVAKLWVAPSQPSPEAILRARRALTDLDKQQKKRAIWVVESEYAEVVAWTRACFFRPAPDAPTNSIPEGWYLMGVNVLPSWRRRGLGTALCQLRLDWLRTRTEVVWTFTDHDNFASIALHKNLGFQITRGDVWSPGLEDHPKSLTLMRCELAEKI